MKEDLRAIGKVLKVISYLVVAFFILKVLRFAIPIAIIYCTVKVIAKVCDSHYRHKYHIYEKPEKGWLIKR